MSRKICQNYSLKRFPEAVSQSYTPKYLCKAIGPNLFLKIILQSGSRKLLPKVATEGYSPKLRFKIISQRCSSFKAAVQSCSASKLLRTAAKAPKSCFEKRFAKMIFQNYSPKLLFFKATVCQCCLQSRKIIPPNRSSKFLPEAAFQKRSPKFQCCYPKLLQSWSGKLKFFKAAVQSFSSKLLPKAAPQSCAQSGSPKLLP